MQTEIRYNLIYSYILYVFCIGHHYSYFYVDFRMKPSTIWTLTPCRAFIKQWTVDAGGCWQLWSVHTWWMTQTALACNNTGHRGADFCCRLHHQQTFGMNLIFVSLRWCWPLPSWRDMHADEDPERTLKLCLDKTWAVSATPLFSAWDSEILKEVCMKKKNHCITARNNRVNRSLWKIPL